MYGRCPKCGQEGALVTRADERTLEQWGACQADRLKWRLGTIPYLGGASVGTSDLTFEDIRDYEEVQRARPNGGQG